jgi:hypothetical protein
MPKSEKTKSAKPKRKKIKKISQNGKFYIDNKKICPPHRLPHKLPLGKKITVELCHIHIRKRSMAHHRPFCRILKCKHYTFMVNEYKKYKRIKKELKNL